MSRVSTFALAGVTALVVGSGALAADLAAPYQPVATGGWYLRGYIGQSNQFVNSISHPSFATAPQSNGASSMPSSSLSKVTITQTGASNWRKPRSTQS